MLSPYLTILHAQRSVLSTTFGDRGALMSPSATLSQTYSSCYGNKHPDFHMNPQWSVDWCLLCLGQVGPTQEPT